MSDHDTTTTSTPELEAPFCHLPSSVMPLVLAESHSVVEDIARGIMEAVAAQDWEGVTFAFRRMDACYLMRYQMPRPMAISIVTALLPVMMASDLVPPWHFTNWSAGVVKILQKEVEPMGLALDWASLHTLSDQRTPRKSVLYAVHSATALILQSLMQLQLALQPHTDGTMADNVLHSFKSKVCPHFTGDSTLAFLRVMTLFPVASCTDAQATALIDTAVAVSGWKNSPHWHSAALSILFRFAKFRPSVRWGPYATFIMQYVLGSFRIPAGCSDTGYPRFVAADEVGVVLQESDLEARICIAVLDADMASPTWTLLARFLRSTDVLYYVGSRSMSHKVADFVSSLTKHMLIRVRKQKKLRFPESKWFTEAHLTRFTEALMPSVLSFFESKHGISGHGVLCLKRLACLAPAVSCKAFLPKVDALAYVTDPNVMITLLEAISDVIGHGISRQVPGVLEVLPPFVSVVLEGINANNIGRTLASFHALRVIFMRIPLDADADGAPAIAALFEDWALGIVSQILVFAQSYTESKLSTEVEREMRAMCSILFATMSDAILAMCLSSIRHFVSSNLCVSTRKIVGNLLASAVERNPSLLADILRPLARNAFPSRASDDVTKADVEWHGYMYTRAISNGGEGALQHIPEVEAIVATLMRAPACAKWHAKAAGKIVYNTLRTLTEIRPFETWHVNPGTIDARSAASWGRLYHPTEVTVSWLIPGERSVAAAAALASRLFMTLRDKIDAHLASLTPDSDHSGRQDTLLTSLVLLRYVVRGATPVMAGAPWKGAVPVCIDLSEASACFSYADVIDICDRVVAARQFMSVKCLNLVNNIVLLTLATRGGTTKRKTERRKIAVEKTHGQAQSCDGTTLRIAVVQWAHYSLLRRYVALTCVPYSDLVARAVGILFNLSTGLFSTVRRKAQAAIASVGRLLLRRTRREQMMHWLGLLASAGADLKEETVTGVCHLMQSPTYLMAFAEEQDIIRGLMSTLLSMPTFDRITVQVRIHAAFAAILGHLWEIEVHTAAELGECERFSGVMVSAAHSELWQKTERAQKFAMFFVRSPSPLRAPIRVAPCVYGLMFESLTHASPQIAMNALENIIKLCCVHKTTPPRFEVPYDPSDRSGPFVDSGCLGFACVPATVVTFDYSGKTQVAPAGPFAPTAANKAAFAAALAAGLTPDVLSRVVELRSTKGKSIFFYNTQARFWKGLFRVLQMPLVEWARPVLAGLIDKGCTNNVVEDVTKEKATKADAMNMCHRGSLSCACEILAGMFRATRHWDRERAAVVEALVAATLETIIARAPQESTTDIGSALAFSVTGLDPRRYDTIQRVLLDRRFFEEEEPTPVLKRRLQLADRILESASWRCRPRVLAVLRYLAAHGMTQQHQVRMVVATLAATCVEILWDPAAPSHDPDVTAFFAALRDSVASSVARHNAGQAIDAPKALSYYWDTAFRVVMLVIGRGSCYTADCRVMMSACLAFLSLEHSELCDDDMSVVVVSCVKKLMHSHLPVANVTALLSDAVVSLGDAALTKAGKLCLLFFLEGLVFANQFRLTPADVDVAIEGCRPLLGNRVKAVRCRAADTTAFLLRVCPPQIAAKRAAAFAGACKDPETRLLGVVGLRAVATAYPDSVPPFIPPTLTTLGRYVGDRDGDVSSTVKETFAAWWQAHNAAWQHGQKELFSEAQQDVVTELVYSTSYFV